MEFSELTTVASTAEPLGRELLADFLRRATSAGLPAAGDLRSG